MPVLPVAVVLAGYCGAVLLAWCVFTGYYGAVLLVAVGLRGHALAWHVANITCVVKHAWHVHRHANVGMWVQTVAGVGAWAC